MLAHKQSSENNRWNLWFGICVVMFLISCSKKENSRTVDILTVAVLPDQSEVQLRDKYQPLLKNSVLITIFQRSALILIVLNMLCCKWTIEW